MSSVCKRCGQELGYLFYDGDVIISDYPKINNNILRLDNEDCMVEFSKDDLKYLLSLFKEDE